MDITIYASFLPPDGPDAALAFCRGSFGFEVRTDAGYHGTHRITIGPPAVRNPAGNMVRIQDVS